jgi:glycosyltransferase involved in cell wall biosynthesis
MQGTIVIFSTAYLPFWGGAETAIKGITDDIDNFHFIILTSRFRKSISRQEKMGKVIVYRLGLGSSFDKYLLPFLALLKFLKLKDNLKRPILFWGMMASYGSLGAIFLKYFFPKIPFLLTIQEGDREWERNRFWLRLILKKADYVTAISSFLLGEVRKMGYEGKAEVVPNGVDLNKFQIPKSKSQTNSKFQNSKIISVSRRVYKNGIDTLEKAFKIVKKKFPDAKLRIISDAPHEDIPKYLWEADVFVRPSRSEGLGTAFLEAMAAGLPIIGTKVGGIPDFLKDGETGLFTKVDDAEDLAEKIILLLTDENLRQRLAQNGRKLVEEKYQWSKIAQRFREIFPQLCAS